MGINKSKLDDNQHSVDMNALHGLLRNVGIILKVRRDSEEFKQNFNDSFTVFSALNIENLELKHCQIISELLNPNGKHGMGSIFLKSFFKMVLDKEKEVADNDLPRVHTEYVIKNKNGGGRMDIYIETATAYYPIEVKIGADDQDCQLSRYYQYVKNKSDNNFVVYYLTLDGHKPSEKSIKGLNEQDLKNVKIRSFEKHVLPWLKNCAELSYSSPNVYGSIHQYITLVEKLTLKHKEEILQEDLLMSSIENVISLSGEYFNAAKKIAESFHSVQPNKMKDIFNRIKIHMQKTHHLNGVFEQDEIDEYYSGGVRIQKNATVSLEFRLDTYAEAKVSLNLVFEICGDADSDDQFYYGVVIKNANTDEYDADFVQDMKQDIANIFNNQNWKDLVAAIPEDKCWVWWKNLPSKSEEPNFRKCDDNYLRLYNPADYEQIMNEIFKEIDTNLEFIRNNGVPPKLLNVGTWL